MLAGCRSFNEAVISGLHLPETVPWAATTPVSATDMLLSRPQTTVDHPKEQRSTMEPGQIGARIAELKERADSLWRYL